MTENLGDKLCNERVCVLIFFQPLSHIGNISTLADIEQQVPGDRRKYSSNSNHSMIHPSTPRRAISTIALNHSNAGSLSTSSGTDSFKGNGRFYHVDFVVINTKLFISYM